MGSGPSGKGTSQSRNTSASTTTNTTSVHTDNRIYQSDFGAVEAGTDVARDAIISNERTSSDAINALSDVSSDALSLGADAFDSANDNLNLGLGFALDTYESSLKFGEKAIDTVGENARDFSDALSDNSERGFNFADSVLTGLFGFASDTIDKIGEQAESLAGQSIAGNQSLAKTTSESADDRVARLGLYGFVAIAAIMVLPAIFGKAR